MLLTVKSGRGHQVGFPRHVQALDRPRVEGKQALWIRSLHTDHTSTVITLDEHTVYSNHLLQHDTIWFAVKFSITTTQYYSYVAITTHIHLNKNKCNDDFIPFCCWLTSDMFVLINYNLANKKFSFFCFVFNFVFVIYRISQKYTLTF